MKTTRVLLADDEPKVRFALRVLLERKPGMVVAGEATDAAELLAQMAEWRPHVVIVDWLLPGLAEAGSFDILRQICPDVAIIAVSGRPEMREEALKAGANSFVSKIDPPESLLSALKDRRTRETGR